jgi:hypothetical protein
LQDFLMSTLLRCALRMIVAGTFALVVPALASSPDAEPAKSFKLAMGPMSAAQKNQTPAAAENSPGVDIKPRYRIKHHHPIKHRRHHHRTA